VNPVQARATGAGRALPAPLRVATSHKTDVGLHDDVPDDIGVHEGTLVVSLEFPAAYNPLPVVDVALGSCTRNTHQSAAVLDTTLMPSSHLPNGTSAGGAPPGTCGACSRDQTGAAGVDPSTTGWRLGSATAPEAVGLAAEGDMSVVIQTGGVMGSVMVCWKWFDDTSERTGKKQGKELS